MKEPTTRKEIDLALSVYYELDQPAQETFRAEIDAAANAGVVSESGGTPSR